jgi:hypothetical protein
MLNISQISQTEETDMRKNVGTIDRILRIVAGVAILGAGVYYNSWWGLIGLVPLATGLLSTCPAYMPLGLSTCKKEEQPAA